MICKFRNVIGCKQVSNIFAGVKRQMQKKNCCAEVFTFVDTTALTSKIAMWEERDKAIKDGVEYEYSDGKALIYIYCK
jgi:hypothetical protein